MTIPTSTLGFIGVSNNIALESLGKRHSFPRLSLQEIRQLSLLRQTSTSTFDKSPTEKTHRQRSHQDSLSPLSSETYTFRTENHTRKRRHPSINDLLATTKEKVQKFRDWIIFHKDSFFGSKEEEVIFSEKYTLDLPQHISRDKSELEYLRRCNEEEAAAALAIKNATNANPISVKQTSVLVTSFSHGHETRNISLAEEIEIKSSKKQINNNTEVTIPTRRQNDDDDSGSKILAPVEKINNNLDTKDDTESWESKLARNPFDPFRDFRLDMEKKINTLSDSDTI